MIDCHVGKRSGDPWSGSLFNSGTVRIGRDVELRRGYAKEGALWGMITDIIITRHVYDVPPKVKKELFQYQ